MKPYPKIQSVFKRDPETNYSTFIEEKYSTPELEYLKDNEWYFTEKLDGTNVRTIFYPLHNLIEFKGRTDKAEMPKLLLKKLKKLFTREKLWEAFDIVDEYIPITLYGEGVGYKIQKNGQRYVDGNKDNDFVLFDIKIGNWWLKREDVENIAKKLKIKVAPIVGEGTLDDAVDLIKNKGLKSQWGDFKAEGIVIKPKTQLFDRIGKRIITKLKHNDWDKEVKNK